VKGDGKYGSEENGSFGKTESTKITTAAAVLKDPPTAPAEPKTEPIAASSLTPVTVETEEISIITVK